MHDIRAAKSPRPSRAKIDSSPCSGLPVTLSRVILASDGCLQYFTGVNGQILSFNYNGASGLQLSNTDYSVCIRMERNFCGIQYSACTDTGEKG